MQWDGLFADFGLSALDTLLPDVPTVGGSAVPVWDGRRGPPTQPAAAIPLDRNAAAWRPASTRDTRSSARQAMQGPSVPFPPSREEEEAPGDDVGRSRRKRRAPARISEDAVAAEGGGGSDFEEDDESDLKSGDRKRKSRREKARRDSINRLFAELSVLCDPNKPSKRDRLEILNEAVQEMRRLQDFAATASRSKVASGAPGGYMGDYQRGNGLKNYPFGSVPICE